MEVSTNDEIDFFNLLNVVLRWKFLILGIIIAGLIIISIIFYKTPVSYTATGTIKIGKIAGIPLEKFEDLNLYLLSLENYDNYKIAEIAINKKMSSIDLDTIVLSISSTGSNFDEATQTIDQTAKLIIERHEKIYNESIEKLKKVYLGNTMHVAPNYYLIVSSYSYPSEIIDKIQTVQKKSVIKVNVDEKNKKSSIPLKSLFKYIIISVIALAFTGIMGAFILDYILSEILKRKK